MNVSVEYISESGVQEYVYTDPNHDPTGIQRLIPRGGDVYYPGTCESDVICYNSVEQGEASEADTCPEGYICDEQTSSESSVYYSCREGYVCDFGTTPDTNLPSARGQFRMLCPAGYYCQDGTGLGQAFRNECPANSFCPTGTAEPVIGNHANDALNRELSSQDADPYYDTRNLVYMGNDDVRVLSIHDNRCKDGADKELQLRYVVEWLPEHEDLLNPSIEYLAEAFPGYLPYQNDSVLTGYDDGKFYRPSIVNQATFQSIRCARDHKWRLVDQAIYRAECDCVTYFQVVTAVYRLWKCTGDDPLDDLGIGSVNKPYYGNRDVWFRRIHKTDKMCLFYNASNFNLTHGYIPHNPAKPSIGNNNRGVLNLHRGLEVQFSWTLTRNFSNYNDLKVAVEAEFESEVQQITDGSRTNIDPFVYDLYNAVRALETYGERLEELVWLEEQEWIDGTMQIAPGRHDVCECQQLHKCPNGTESLTGSVSVSDCVSTGVDVLRRVNAVPSWFNNSSPHMKNMTDFWELGGADSSLSNGEQTYAVGTVSLEAMEVATVTVDLSGLETNLTYGDHYVIAVYVNCKPCPARYKCNYLVDPPTCSEYPPFQLQEEKYKECLERYKLESCLTYNASIVDCDNPNVAVRFEEPDLFRCRQIPYFCDDRKYPKYVWDIVYGIDGNGGKVASNKEEQEESTWVEEDDWQEDLGRDYWVMTKGCCQCERHALPYYFLDKSADEGFPDNKHEVTQISVMALEKLDVTITIELLNGIYYSVFDNYIPDKGDIWIHTPGRAKYTKHHPSRAAFLAVLEAEDFEFMELPLNLPVERYRLPFQPTGGAAGTTDTRFENFVLINRISNMYAGDPTYTKRYEARKRAAYFEYIIEHPNSTLTFAEFATIPDLEEISENLYSVVDQYDDVVQDSAWFSVGDSNGENDFLALPYFPFFSSCNAYDSYLSISKLLETHPDCRLVSYDNTKPVDQYIWNAQLIPNADKCQVSVPKSEQYRVINQERVQWFGDQRGAVMNCTFEEQIDIPTGNPRWFELAAGETLFYMTKEPIKPKDFDPVYRQNPDFTRNYTRGWGRGPSINGMRGTYQMIPVVVDDLAGGLNNVVPRQVLLTISYYQVLKGYKRLVSAVISYLPDFQCHTLTSGSSEQKNLEKQGIPQCVTDFNGDIATSEYQLEVVYLPLPWFDLLNLFEFTADVYMTFFTLVGIISITVAAIVWAINRVLTKLRHPPPFHSYVLYHIISEAPIVGCIVAVTPILIASLWISSWLKSYEDGGTLCSPDPVAKPSTTCFEDIPGDWSDSLALDLTRINMYRVGRMGVCLIGVGLYVTFLSARLLVPKWTDTHSGDDVHAEELPDANGDEDEKIAPSPIWAPNIWKRAHLMLASILLQLFLMIGIEFSFSAMFGDNVYMYIILFKCLQKYMDVLFEDLLKEQLMMVPLVILYTVIEGLMTMGADSFSDFTLSYFVELCVMVIERLYLDPCIGEITKLWPRWMMQLRRTFGSNRRMTREEKAEEELEWRRINEEIELESEGIEPLLDSYTGYSTEVSAMFIFPVVNIILLIFYNEIQIAPMYGILENHMIYYILFAVYIIPFLLAMDVFLLNCQELIHGWKVYDYVSYQRYRFSVRDHRWMLRSTLVDESISEGFQTLDMLCFSSQYYFVVTLFTMGMLMNMFGMVIFLRSNYNPFGDPVTTLLIVLMIIFCELLQLVMRRLADVKILRLGWRGMWMTKQIEGTVDDDVAAKLAIGEGRQQDLEQERMELQALNSERFRHRFLERNRPWILQHLVELLTPRSLESTGPDGRPVIEYVRDVYAELMAMGEGMKRAGDREDVSSDEEDELEAARRNWPRQPVTGASLAIARLWLAKARKRRAFAKLIRGIIDQHKKSACESCGKTPEVNGVKLVAHLATNGVPDTYAIDRLIALFEEHYSVNELDPQLWKAFFRAHAEYATRCTLCEDAMEQERLMRAGREPGMGRVTRPEDISSDDEADEQVFEPMLVNRGSPEGRMMSKWLQAARTKLGGQFPREDARVQMEKYAQKMRQLKIKKAKEAIGGGSEAKRMEEQKRALEEQFGPVDVNATTAALAQRWIRKARESLEAKFRGRSQGLRDELEAALAQMPEHEDWYFGAELRLEGQDLLTRGLDLSNDRRTLEAEAAIKIKKIENDLNEFISEKEEELDRERKVFEKKIAEDNDKIAIEIEARAAELEKAKQEKRKEFDKEEKRAADEQGAAPTEMIQNHRNHIAEMDQNAKNERKRAEENRSNDVRTARTMFNRQEEIQRNEMARRKAMASDSIARIRQELTARIKASESDWQAQSAKWHTIAKKKIQVKQREDLEAKKVKKKR